MSRAHRVITVLLLVALLAAACGGSSDDANQPLSPTADATPTASPAAPSPQPSALSCGAEITESVALTADMHCDPVALIVAGDDVVVDLGGHTISGPGPGRRSWPLPNFDVAGIIVRGANAVIRNGTITETGIGVLLNGEAGAENVTVSEITTTGNYYGLYLYRSAGNTIDGNAVRANVYGLHLQESNGNTLINNDLSAQTHHSPGGYGLYMYASNENRIEFNTVQENLNWGLWFSDSTSNTVVRNNIIANDPQVSDDSGGNLFYDAETREGNYWSDYTAEDANADGIGDLPYAIGGPGRSADIYPFKAENGWENRTTGTLDLATPPSTPKLPPRVYVALENGDIAALDAATGEQIGVWEVGVMGSSLALSPDGTRLYAFGGDSFEATNVIAIDTETGEIVDNWEAAGATVLAATYDGERVIASSDTTLYEIVLDTDEVRTQHDGANAVAIVPSWKHNLVLVADARGYLSVVYLPDQHAAYSMDLSGTPIQAVDNRAGTRLFVTLDKHDEVYVIDTEQFIVTDRIPLGDVEAANARIAPSPDGTTLYLLDRAASSVRAIDLGTKQVIEELSFAGQVVEVAVTGDGEYVAVAITGGVTLYDRDLGVLHFIELHAASAVMATAQ
jgi:parallel beta-helix repeat protein